MRIQAKPPYFPASLVLIALALASTEAYAIPAFPGAQGFGAEATGGRGGSAYVVTNLNDSGSGSFRDAVSQPNRYVVFAVGGIIRIRSRIPVAANLTIAGQTAPGEGITIYGNGLSYSNANNTITRHLRIRMGVVGDSGADALTIAAGHDMIFDHVSVSWGRDETFSISGSDPSRITIQDSIIAQGLQTHSCGGLIQTSGGVSILRCLYISNNTRNPKVKGVNEFVNNVVYNWGAEGGYILGDSAGPSYANVIENYFIEGPDTDVAPFTRGNLNFHIYALNNTHDADRDGALDGAVIPETGYTVVDWMTTPFAYPVTSWLTAAQAYAHVAANAGASRVRDRIDRLFIDELTSLGMLGEIISNENDGPINGPEPVAGGNAPLDSDLDGMPDVWEVAVGLDPAVADHNGDADGNGYTNLEDYLNGLVAGGIQKVAIAGVLDDTGVLDNDAITSDATLTLFGTADPGSTVTLTRIGTGPLGSVTADAAGDWSLDYGTTPLTDGPYAFSATATGADGLTSTPTPAFMVTVDTSAPDPAVITSVGLAPGLVVNGTCEPGGAVDVMLVGVGSLGSAVADATGLWSVAYSGEPPAPGVHTFTAVATDQAGNAAAASFPYVVDTSIAPPAILAVSDDTGLSPADRITTDTTPVLSGTAPIDSVVSLTRLGVGVLGSVAVAPDGTWTLAVSSEPLAPGSYTFAATASTASGNSSPMASPFTVTIDTQVPVVASILRQNPLSAAMVAGDVTLRVAFSEAVAGVDLADFSLTLTGATSGTLAAVTPLGADTYDVLVTGVAGEGTLRVDLKASGTGISDVAGNSIQTGYTAGQIYTVRAAGSSVWIIPESDGLWSDPANWQDGLVAGGISATADFATLDLGADTTVHLDQPQTIGHLMFGDTDASTPASWLIEGNGDEANAFDLAVASGSPTLTVNALGTGATATIATGLSGTVGLTKAGAGTLVLTSPNAVGGPLAVRQGTLRVGPGGTLSTTTVTVATGGAQLNVAGGSFVASGLTTLTPRNSSIVIADGSAVFDGGLTSTNTRDAIFRVTGGTVTARDVSFPRTSDSGINYGTGLIIQGGNTTIGTVNLGTNNSWGVMSVEGGSLTVTGPVTLGHQVTGGRGGALRVTGGTFNVDDATLGLVMARNPGTNPNNVAHANFLGGVSTVARLTLGYDATVTAGAANVNLSGGALYVGSGGMVKNGAGTFAGNVNLTAGTLGAAADWSADVNMNLPAANTVALKAADVGDTPHAITLSGVLAGAGGFSKTGGGSLTLTGASTFTGPVTVDAGALRVDGSLAPGEPLAVNAGGTLTGSGAVSRALVLKEGGWIVPDPVLTAESLTWNGGGGLAFDLALGKTLALAGAFAKSSLPGHNLALSASTPLTVGALYTLVTFGTTDFMAGDFGYSGLEGYRGVFIVGPGSLQFLVTGAGASAEYTHWAYLAGLPPDQSGPSQDPDSDGTANLLEFVLGHDPLATGPEGIVATSVEADGRIYPAISFVRRANLGGVMTEVRIARDLAFTTLIEPIEVSTTPRGDGTEQVLVRSAVSLRRVPRQFFRLAAALPDEPVALSAPVGVMTERLSRGLTGLAFPLIAMDLLVGIVETNTASALAFPAGPNVGALLASGRPYYVEVVQGPLAGERFDVDTEATIASSDSTVALALGGASYSTLPELPENALQGARCALRPHLTLAGLQAMLRPGLVGGDYRGHADGVWLLQRGHLVRYFLRSDQATWSTGHDSEDHRGKVIPPDSGVLVETRARHQRWLHAGLVRTNAFRKNLAAGLQSFATGFPQDLTPVEIGAFVDPAAPATTRWTGSNVFAFADQIQRLHASRTPFELYYLRGDGSTWRSLMHHADLAGRPILGATDMIVLRRVNPDPGYRIERPFGL